MGKKKKKKKSRHANMNACEVGESLHIFKNIVGLGAVLKIK